MCFSRLRAAFAVWVVAAVAVAPAAGRAQQMAPVWGSWIAGLASQGYGISQGTAYEISSNAASGVHGAGAKTEAAEPPYAYLETSVPVGGGYVDPYYGTRHLRQTAAGVETSAFYQLGTGEAVITIVNLPPLAAYFSFQSNLYTRPACLYAHPQELSADPARAVVFGSTNNGINNVDIQRASGLGFGQGTVAFITTSNAALAQSLTASFAAAGGNPNLVFADPMGANLNPGLGAGYDEFVSLFRYSVAEDPDAATAWGANAAGNILVYRVEQPAGGAVSRYGSIGYLPKAENADESVHAAALNELSGLLQGWLAVQKGAAATVTPTVSSLQVSPGGTLTSGAFGGYCIANGTVCGGDEQDSDAYKIASLAGLPAGGMLIVDGVDHTATNTATYAGLSIQNIRTATYIAVVTQANAGAAGFSAGTMSGSAGQVLQDLGLYGQASAGLIADLPNLYVQIFARSCDPAQVYCTRGYTTLLSTAALPLNDPVKVTERAYVLPGFVNGGNPDFLLDPQVVH